MSELKGEISSVFSNKLIFSKNSTYPILKFSFNSKILHIILTSNFKNLLEIPKNLLLYQTLSIILIIFQEPISLEAIFQYMLSLSYLNVVCVYYMNFESNSEFFTYDVVGNNFCLMDPICNACASYNVSPLLEKNIYHFNGNLKLIKNFETFSKTSISLHTVNEFPRAQLYSTIEAFGYIARIVHSFSDWVGSGLRLHITSDSALEKIGKKMEKLELESHSDFSTAFEKFYINQNLHEIQKMSTVLEIMPWLIIVPVSKPLPIEYYIFKPFDGIVWFLIILTVISISVIAKGNFLVNFCDFLRATLSQSYIFHSISKTSKWHIMCVGFGFIFTTWYISLIGSFVTTNLYNKPLKTFEDIRKSGLKILIDNQAEISFSEISQNFDIFQIISRVKFFQHGNLNNDSYGYLEYGDRWEYYFKPRMAYDNRQYFRATGLVVSYFPISFQMKINFIYREKFNRFLNLIRDVGLYQGWTKKSFTEAINYKLKGVLKLCKAYDFNPQFNFADKVSSKELPKIRVLEIKYFMYILIMIIVGWSLSIFILLIECFNKKFRK